MSPLYIVFSGVTNRVFLLDCRQVAAFQTYLNYMLNSRCRLTTNERPIVVVPLVLQLPVALSFGLAKTI